MVDMAEIETRTRHRICKNCSQTFSYEVGKGRDRVHCTPACRIAMKVVLPRAQWPRCATPHCERTASRQQGGPCSTCKGSAAKAAAGVCTIHKCSKPATRANGQICEAHYYRARRAERHTPKTPRVRVGSRHPAGYMLIPVPGHPMAGKSGLAFEHRVIAYERGGAGDQDCHWCGTKLSWAEAVIDHLNEVKDDNRPENLVVACSPCNRARGSMIPFIGRMKPERIADLIATFPTMRVACKPEG